MHLLPLAGSNAYLCRDDSGVTLIDTGPPGSAAGIKSAMEQLGLERCDLRRIVLTHCHDDHAGSAAEMADWSGARVIAGAADAPVICGEQAQPPIAFTPSERVLHAVVAAGLRPAPQCRVGQRAEGRLQLDDARGLVLLDMPGHTPGSIAVHLPELGVLITGDTVAEHEGQVVLGPFNADRAGAWRSLERLAELEVDVACFGHGQPVVGGASAALRSATDPFGH